MVRHEVLSTLDDPCQVAHAELFSVSEGEGNRQPGRISQRLKPRREALRRPIVHAPPAESLRTWKIKTEKFALIRCSHIDILTSIGTYFAVLVRDPVSRWRRSRHGVSVSVRVHGASVAPDREPLQRYRQPRTQRSWIAWMPLVIAISLFIIMLWFSTHSAIK